jgi:cyclopropane-fatty-acyl-phospholipid synthase
MHTISSKRTSNQSVDNDRQVGTDRKAVQELLARADVRINGDRPWDIQVHNPELYQHVLSGGSLAFGEAYMDGWWDCAALDECVNRLMAARLHEEVRSWHVAWNVVKAKLLNLQSRSRAYRIGERHYDRGNDLFEVMLDDRMTYTCGYWKDATSLEDAQKAKLDLVCRKIGLEAGDRVLDIGCGWGSFLQYAAEEYGGEGVGLTVSEEQARLGRERCAGLPVEIRLQDYRDLQGEAFDHVVSVGMFEHVGSKNYETFFDVARRCLRPDGLFLLETIGAERSSPSTDPWINKYIFPNGSIPSASQITGVLEGRFVIEDWHNFGPDYDRTLMAWHERFTDHWDMLKGRYDERFYRMWTFYLLSCAGSFRARHNRNWQLVLSPEGVAGSYRSVR